VRQDAASKQDVEKILEAAGKGSENKELTAFLDEWRVNKATHTKGHLKDWILEPLATLSAPAQTYPQINRKTREGGMSGETPSRCSENMPTIAARAANPNGLVCSNPAWGEKNPPRMTK
jgi:hypothetical protein